VKPCWIDGQLATGLPVDDRGLAYGDGLFETIKVVRGKPQLFERHLQRLDEGCRRLAIPLDLPLVRAEVLAFCGELDTGVAKLTVTRWCRPPRLCTSATLLSAAPAARLVTAGLSGTKRADRRMSVSLRDAACRATAAGGLKHLNRLEQVLARAEWQDSAYAEGLMRDSSGRVIEGVFSNLFIVRDAVLLTAALQRCGVAGVMRAELIERAQQLGVAVVVRDLAYEELLAADEVLLCNSLYGIWPVVALAGHTWPVGVLTRKLQAAIADLSSVS